MSKREPSEKQKAVRWKPGQSGNPGGRPRLHDAIAQIIRDTDKGRVAKGIGVVCDRAARGDLASLEWLVSHGWGKPPVEVGGEDGGPIRILVEYAEAEAP